MSTAEQARKEFLDFVRKYVASDPEVAPFVTDHIRQGINDALQRANARAADMETALAIALSRRWKGSEQLIKDKLKEWDGKTALNWSSFLETNEKR